MTIEATSLVVVGVRHHSPACAALVRHVIERERPLHVLIEGPADFNGRFDELALGHELPVAIFTYYQDATRRRASWTPFCVYSPEWVALEAARSIGAEARFCDLPAWDTAFDGRSNRYADLESARERARARRVTESLCARTRTDDSDALWDHLFEQPAPAADLEARLAFYFDELRGEESGGERDGPREALMSRWVAWALRDAAERGERKVVLVCGGWHAPVVRRAALQLAQAPAELPTIAAPPDADVEGRPIRHGSHLVPYSYRRLDAFAGYDAGMPSPEYHEWVWTEGHERAAERAIEATTRRVRAKKQPLSTADLIAARSLATALAHVRGHPVTMRTDLLDGLAGALVKDGLEVPFPWQRRGILSPRTEPILVEVVAALSGDREGRLAARTPRPPLTADIAAELERHSLEVVRKPRSVSISLRDELGRAKSRVLHRLRVLSIPGFVRELGPKWATDATLDETWTISAPLEQAAAIIEASQWGGTLEGAAFARLERALLDADGRLRVLAEILGVSVFVGIRGLEARVMAEVARAISGEPSLGELGAAMSRLLDLTLHGELFDAANAAALEAVLVAAFDRGLWLLEGLNGAGAPSDDSAVDAVVALRDLLVRGPAEVRSARERADGVLLRRSVDRQGPPAVRGACLGALWSLGRLGDPDVATAHAIQAVQSASLPAVLGNFLTGLFATARTEVLESDALVAAIDRVLALLGDHEAMIALPSMRLAFSHFPPKEREQIAERVLALHGRGSDEARSMVRRLEVRPEDVAAGVLLERATLELARRHGLEDALDAEAP